MLGVFPFVEDPDFLGYPNSYKKEMAELKRRSWCRWPPERISEWALYALYALVLNTHTSKDGGNLGTAVIFRKCARERSQWSSGAGSAAGTFLPQTCPIISPTHPCVCLSSTHACT